MIDKFLEFGSGFDWITPTFSLFGHMRGKVSGVRVPKDWQGHVMVTLGAADIKICNGFICDGEFVFDVRVDDLEETVRLLGLVPTR